MTRLTRNYCERFIRGDASPDSLSCKLAKASDKDMLCADLIARLIFSDIAKDDLYPPETLSSDILYQKAGELLAHKTLSRYAATQIVLQANGYQERAIELISKVCQGKPEHLLKLIVNLPHCKQPPADSIRALHQLLEATEESVWLDAAKTTKTKIELYQFTKWPTVRAKLSKRDRGLILEGELGL